MGAPVQEVPRVIAHAVPGDPHSSLPGRIEDWEAGTAYAVIPWRCPECDQVVAETVVSPERPNPVKTVISAFSAVRQPEADEDGVPFYGPTSRARRGRSERRKVDRLANEILAAVEDCRPDGGRPIARH